MTDDLLTVEDAVRLILAKGIDANCVGPPPPGIRGVAALSSGDLVGPANVLSEYVRRLIARVEDAEGRLAWTDAKPTVPGRYWYRGDIADHCDSWGLVEYREGGIFEGAFFLELDTLTGQFAGPIPHPVESREGDETR